MIVLALVMMRIVTSVRMGGEIGGSVHKRRKEPVCQGEIFKSKGGNIRLRKSLKR